ncbi:hypothetical protein EBZ37_11440 [bacterium]|nr:hypothetical protein [bacterium]
MKINRESYTPKKPRVPFLILFVLVVLAAWNRWTHFSLSDSFLNHSGGRPKSVGSGVAEPVARERGRTNLAAHPNRVPQSEAPRKGLSIEQRRFVDSGWTLVQESAPDHRVVDLDVSALAENQNDFQHQLQTNSYSGKSLDRVAEVARISSDGKTRYVAIESLGRSQDPRAQSLLVSLYDQMDQESRSQILEFLRPSSMNDPVLGLLIREVNRSDLSEKEREQAAFPMIAYALTRESAEESQRIQKEMVSRIERTWQKKFERLFQLVQAGGSAGHLHE